MCELWVCMSYSVTFSKRLSCGMSGECCPNIQNICSNTADSHSSWYYINLHLWHQATPVVKLFWLANQRWKCCCSPPQPCLLKCIPKNQVLTADSNSCLWLTAWIYLKVYHPIFLFCVCLFLLCVVFFSFLKCTRKSFRFFCE